MHILLSIDYSSEKIKKYFSHFTEMPLFQPFVLDFLLFINFQFNIQNCIVTVVSTSF